MLLGNARSTEWLRRGSLGLVLCLLLPVPRVAAASGLRIHTDLGPENSRRALRRVTRYIVLHTTEGREAGSLRKLWTRGEAHYFVRNDGRVVRLLDRSRIATHAGSSLWDGRSDLDDLSIGIEVSGYHDREPTRAQSEALRELLRQLQGLHGIKDEDVLTHSMVAYGVPNQFHPYRHRGRKRCAMVFARPEVRRKLGLTKAPAYDPDVQAGRLRVGDRELQRRLYPSEPVIHRASAQPPPPPRQVLASAPVAEPSAETASVETAPAEPVTVEVPVATAEGTPFEDTITADRTAWSIAGRAYSSPTTLYVFPDGTEETGDAIDNWEDMPEGTRLVLGGAAPAEDLFPETPSWAEDEEGLILVSKRAAARELIGAAAVASTTTYIFTNGSVKTGAELNADIRGRRQLEALPRGTRILVGYVNAGRLTPTRSLARVAGNRWNEPSTYYRLPSGHIRAGVEIEDARLPQGTLVFFPN